MRARQEAGERSTEGTHGRSNPSQHTDQHARQPVSVYTTSQADSAGSIPVTRPRQEATPTRKIDLASLCYRQFAALNAGELADLAS